MQVKNRAIQGESIGQTQRHFTVPEAFSVENLWLGGLNWKQRIKAKSLIREKDVCCDRNFGCDGCYMLNECTRDWDRKMAR